MLQKTMEMFTEANIHDFDDCLHNELGHEKLVTLVHFKNSHLLTCRVNKFCDRCGNITTQTYKIMGLDNSNCQYNL
jgi:hypothetical protein